jgi:hypothetical protein
MASKLISYDRESNSFNFGNQQVTDKDLRHAVADALRKSRWSNGPEIVEFLQVRVTVQYINQMLDFVDANDWFWDSYDLCTGDHEFDKNRITPGSHWGYAQELKDQGRQDLDTAAWFEEEGELTMARNTRRLAGQTFNRADRIIKTGRR